MLLFVFLLLHMYCVREYNNKFESLIVTNLNGIIIEKCFEIFEKCTKLLHFGEAD